MNSIYGVSGMDINPLFLLEQAVAITSTGKRLINTVAEFVRGRVISSNTAILTQYTSNPQVDTLLNLTNHIKTVK